MAGGRTALLRVARREVRRNARRSALIVALIAVPVAVVSCGLATQATLEPTDAELRAQDLGRADLVVGSPLPHASRNGTASPPVDPAAVEAALRDVLPDDSAVAAHRRTRLDVSAGDRATGVVVIAADAMDRVNDGTIRLERGRLPAVVGEAAVAPGVARQLDVGLGDTILLHPGEARLEVVGLARATGARLEGTVVVPPGTIASTAWLVDLPAGHDAAATVARLRRTRPLADLEVRGGIEVLREAGVGPALGLDPTWFMIGTLALVWTGVIAAATFAIGARTRLREVGLLAANGATRRQVSRVLLADGLVLGLLGSVLGIAAGLVLAGPVIDHLAGDADREPGSLRIPLAAEVGAVALGTGAALLAARWPAVRAARLPTLAALQSRTTRPPRRVRATLGGAITMASGAVLLGYGASTDAEVPIVAGTMLVVAGVAMLQRLLVDLVARLARRAPLALRFAARDASRQASRTGPAVVASMLALAAAIGAATIISTAGARDSASPQLRGLLPSNRLEVGVQYPDDGPASVDDQTPLDARLPALERALSASFDAPRVGSIWSATTQTPLADRAPRDEPATVQVATLESLAVLGVTDAPTLHAFSRGSVLRVDHDVVPSPLTLTAADGREVRLPAVDVRTGTVGVLGTHAVPAGVADRLGYTRTSSGSVIVDLERPIGDSDLARAHAIALREVGPGVRVWASTGGDCCRSTRRLTSIALGIGLAIALPVLGLVAALTRSEAHTELAVLDAVGMSPRRRRRFAAASVGLLATFAAALALPAGLIPSVLYMRAGSRGVPGGSLVSVPTAGIAVALLGVPTLLAALAWLTAGRPRPVAARRR